MTMALHKQTKIIVSPTFAWEAEGHEPWDMSTGNCTLEATLE